MGVGDMASIGAYADTDQWTWFWIGYGKQIIRDQLNAKEDDLVVHMSFSRKSRPFIQTKNKKREGDGICLAWKSEFRQEYAVVWTIDNQLTAQTIMVLKKFKVFVASKT
jgi:hypothetical protein